MTTDDFDPDNDFDDDFDLLEDDEFDDEPARGRSANAQAADAINSQGGSGGMLKTLILAGVLAGGGYYGYNYLNANKTVTTAAQSKEEATEQVAQQETEIPLPENNTAESSTEDLTTESELASLEDAFSEPLNAPDATTKPKEQVATIPEETVINPESNSTQSKDMVAENTTQNAPDAEDYAGLTDYFAEEKPKTPVEDALPPSTTADAAATTGASTAAAPKPVTPTTQQQSQEVIAVIPDELNQTIDSISEEVSMNINQIKDIESTLQALTTSLNQLNKVITAMDNRVLNLSESVDTLNEDINNVKKVISDEDLDLTSKGQVKPASTKKQPLIYSAPDYVVHAIIPGRAWLKSAQGKIVTVTEGDHLGDYGRVAVIDSNNNIVRTSSGISFR